MMVEDVGHRKPLPLPSQLIFFMGLNPVLMFVRVTVIPKQPCILKFHFPE